MSTSRLDPPQYVLISKNGSKTTNAETLFHPTVIHYHYADDPALPLVSSGQTVLVMDFDDKDLNTLPLVHSLSDDVAVTGVKVSEAPGFIPPPDTPANPFMYVIETTYRTPAQRHAPPPEVDQVYIAQWKLQNDRIRKVVEYGTSMAEAPLSPAPLSATSPPQRSALELPSLIQ